MRAVAELWRRLNNRLFKQLRRRTCPLKKTILALESLEERVVPFGAGQGGGTLGVAHTATIAAGTYTLNNTGFLTFTPTAGTPVTIDKHCATFNVDGTGLLWDLQVGGNLWRLNTNVARAQPVGQRGWTLSDRHVGHISVSNEGTLMDLKTNGNLLRWQGGASGVGLKSLASGVTRADVDAAGDIVFLRDGTLWRLTGAATTSNPSDPGVLDLNTASGVGDGTVVSFSLGNTTLAFQLGIAAGTSGGAGPSQGEVVGTYDITAPAPAWNHLFNDATIPNPEFSITQYAVAADGVIFNRTSDSGADPRAFNRVVRIGYGSFDDDFPGSPLPADTQLTVNGGQAPTDASWFQMSPDGTTIAVLSTGGTGGNNGDLSVYTEGLVVGVPTLSAETPLDTANLGTSFGVANDNRVYEYQGATMTLVQWAFAPSVLSATVDTDVLRWVLGPNGQVSCLTVGTSANALLWFNDFGLFMIYAGGVSDFGVAPNGVQYVLRTNGNLLGVTGNMSHGKVNGTFTLLDGDSVPAGAKVAAFTIGTNSQLYVTETNGRLRKRTTAGGWSTLFNLATTDPDQLFTLPDGSVITLVNGLLEQITADTASVLASGVTKLRWGSGFTITAHVNRDTALDAFPGTVGYNPALNPFSSYGLQFSNVTFSGPFVATTTAPL